MDVICTWAYIISQFVHGIIEMGDKLQEVFQAVRFTPMSLRDLCIWNIVVPILNVTIRFHWETFLTVCRGSM